MVIGVFIDLFMARKDNIHKTLTMLLFFTNESDDLYSSLMDDGLDEKVTNGIDGIKIVVYQPSVTFKYHIGRSMLFVNFKFNRNRMVSKDVYELIDHYKHMNMVTMHCKMDDYKVDIKVSLTWSLYKMRRI